MWYYFTHAKSMWPANCRDLIQISFLPTPMYVMAVDKHACRSHCSKFWSFSGNCTTLSSPDMHEKVIESKFRSFSENCTTSNSPDMHGKVIESRSQNYLCQIHVNIVWMGPGLLSLFVWYGLGCWPFLKKAGKLKKIYVKRSRC